MFWLVGVQRVGAGLVVRVHAADQEAEGIVEHACSRGMPRTSCPTARHVVVVALGMRTDVQPEVVEGAGGAQVDRAADAAFQRGGLGDLSTSAPEITSEGNTSNARSRASSSVARMRLFSVTMLYCGPKPRTLTFWPSPPVVRLMVMPGRCCSESATSASGNRPNSSALMESTTTPRSSCLRGSSRDWRAGR